MKLNKSYTCKISGNSKKINFLEETLDVIQDLSWVIFNLHKRFPKSKWWFSNKQLYHYCRKFFPELNSKFLQNFIRYNYSFKKGQKLPKKIVKPGIFVDYQSFDFQINNNKLSNFWLRFSKYNFPLLGKRILKKIKNPKNVKLAKIYKNLNSLYCKITYVVEVPDIEVSNNSKIVGLDVNTKRYVLSSNKFYHIKKLYHIKREHYRNKQRNKRKTNYTKNLIHTLTTQIANDLSAQGVEVLVLENLTGLRKSASRKLKTGKSKFLNYIINSMCYSMFRNFLTYKCLDRGIKVETIHPAYTSKTCSRCNSRMTVRPRQDKFICNDCNYLLDADLNGSRNIRLWYTQPNELPVNLARAT